MRLCQQGLATAMVRGAAHTTGTAVSGVNASNSTAVGGGGHGHQDQDGRHNERPYTVAFHVFWK